ncbi:hypothetical protein [Devosia sp.]|uniref:hypothetical protein n=1 Tax=Devosia sp. TaxID=1871048 RepID=UPI003263E235
MTSQHRTAPHVNLLLVLAVFAVAAGTLITRAVVSGATTPLFADTDDAMRMVVVRDFLNGQNWYDIVQHRLNTPFGAEVHWSRLVDLPIATIIAIATPFAFGHAEQVAAYIWPLSLLLVLLWLSARLTLRLVGPDGVLPALILPVLSPAVTAEFTPGRMDHHSIQIILTLAMAWASIEALKRPRFALLAGVLCATALAIGTEAVPAVAAAIAAFALLWVLGEMQAKALRWFGLSFAAAALVHMAIALPPSRWLVPACDALSIFYVGAAVVVGVLFTGLSVWPKAAVSPWPKLIAAVITGAIGIAAVLAIDPLCLHGPYASLDPWLISHWIDAIAEAKPWWNSLWDLPAYTIAVGVPGALGLILIGLHLRQHKDRGEWLVLLMFLASATLIMVLQIRGSRLVTLPAIPAAAWLIVSARARYLNSQKLRDAIGLLASWLAFSGIVIVIGVTLIIARIPSHAQQIAETRGDRFACLMPDAFADLKGMAPEQLMTPIDLGSHMLLETPHSVVSAPYHRDAEGVRDTFDFFNEPIAKARTILVRRGIGLVVTCPAMPEMQGQVDAAPDSFVRLAEQDALPSWLKQVSSSGPLKIYAVQPQ